MVLKLTLPFVILGMQVQDFPKFAQMPFQRYSTAFDHCSPLNTNCIKCIKVPGALVNPKGMSVNCLNPLLEVNAVLHLSSGCIAT